MSPTGVHVWSPPLNGLVCQICSKKRTEHPSHQQIEDFLVIEEIIFGWFRNPPGWRKR